MKTRIASNNFAMDMLTTDHRITIKERVANYNRNYPQSLLVEKNAKIYGLWLVGNSGLQSYSSDYYGSYPHGYLDRVMSLFPDIDKRNVVHLFAGKVNTGITIDIKADLNPTYTADVEKHIPLEDNTVALMIADPPYTNEDCLKYCTKPFSRFKVFRECYRVLKPNGHLVWLDLQYPQIVYKNWFNFELVGIIGLVISTMHKIRQITIIRK